MKLSFFLSLASVAMVKARILFEVGVTVYEGPHCTGRNETMMHFQCRFPCYGITGIKSALLEARPIDGRRRANVEEKGLDVTVYKQTCENEDFALLNHRIPEGNLSSCVDFPDYVAAVANCIQPVHLEMCGMTYKARNKIHHAIWGDNADDTVNWDLMEPGKEPQWFKDHRANAIQQWPEPEELPPHQKRDDWRSEAPPPVVMGGPPIWSDEAEKLRQEEDKDKPKYGWQTGPLIKEGEEWYALAAAKARAKGEARERRRKWLEELKKKRLRALAYGLNRKARHRFNGIWK